MQTVVKEERYLPVLETNKPSLLRQIVDMVDEMDEGSKKLLLLTLKKEELSAKYQELDNLIAQSEKVIDEDEIDNIVAETRKEMYEQKICS